MMKNRFIILCCVFFIGSLGSKALSATWLQPPSGWGGFLSSANFHAWPADDFRFDSATSIERVDWWSVGNITDMPEADGFFIRFYSNYYNADLGKSMAGTMLYEVFIPGSAHQSQEGDYCHYYVELPSPFLASENRPYWVSVQGDFTNDPNGNYWWGWAHSNTHNRNPAEYNSLHYNHHPINEPPFYQGNYDLAFELQGSSVPIPGAVWLLGSGVCTLITMRKLRKG